MINLQVVATVRSGQENVTVYLAGVLPEVYRRSRVSNFKDAKMRINKKIAQQKADASGIPIRTRGLGNPGQRQNKELFARHLSHSLEPLTQRFINSGINALTKELLKSAILSEVERMGDVINARCTVTSCPESGVLEVDLSIDHTDHDVVPVKLRYTI